MEYPKSEGRLWINNDKQEGDKKPNWRGRLVITNEQIRMLIDMAKANLEPTIQVGSWNRSSKESGAPYQYLSSEVYMPKQEAQAPQKTPYQPPQDGFQDDDLPF